MNTLYLKPEDEIVFETVHLEDIKIQSDGGLSIKDRLPKEKEIYNIKPSAYILENREKYVSFINTIFEKQYRSQIMGEDKVDLTTLYSNCFGYIHGHEFGGTNPTMINALDLNFRKVKLKKNSSCRNHLHVLVK